jgi:hypothetical protein
VLAVLSAAFFGFSYYGYLTRGYSVWMLLGSLLLFAAFSVLEAFLAKYTRRAILVVFLQSVATVAFFWRVDWRVLAVTWGVVFVFLAWGYVSGKWRLANSIEIPFFGASGTTLGKFTTGILIFMILIYVPQLSSGNVLVISQKSFGTFFDWAASIVNDFYPSVSLDGTFANFSNSLATMELQNNPSFQSLSPDEQNAAITQQTQQFESAFIGNATGTIATSSPASDAFYNVFRGMANAWQSESGGWFIVGWIAVIFIALRSVGIVFNWLAQFVTLVFYELLLATGFMKIREEEHIREVIGF